MRPGERPRGVGLVSESATIRESIGSVNTSAFLDANPADDWSEWFLN